MKPKLTQDQALEMYKEMLDDNYPYKIGYLSYNGSDVFKSVDPIAFRVGFTEYVDSLLELYDVEE